MNGGQTLLHCEAQPWLVFGDQYTVQFGLQEIENIINLFRVISTLC